MFQALFQVFKPSQLRLTERKMSMTRSGRQQRMCSVWYMIRKGNGRQPDNICYLILTISSKNKACDCYCHLILSDLPKKNRNSYCYLIRNCRLKKITFVCLYFLRGWFSSLCVQKYSSLFSWKTCVTSFHLGPCGLSLVHSS